MAIVDAAAMGARMRFRAVVMTSIAFILGLLPLVTANGAAMLSRRGVGTSVFAGMIFATSFGIFLIPMLYATFQTLREGAKRRFGRRPAPGHAAVPQARPSPAAASPPAGRLPEPAPERAGE
jgi:hypothetical protein